MVAWYSSLKIADVLEAIRFHSSHAGWRFMSFFFLFGVFELLLLNVARNLKWQTLMRLLRHSSLTTRKKLISAWNPINNPFSYPFHFPLSNQVTYALSKLIFLGGCFWTFAMVLECSMILGLGDPCRLILERSIVETSWKHMRM